MNSGTEQRSTAFHEASHAIIAALLGATLSKVSIRCQGDTWIGDAEIRWVEGASCGRRQKTFQVAIAGPLGQSKFRASLRWDDVTFDPGDLRSILRIIRRGKLADSLLLSISFIADGGLKCKLEIRDLDDIGDLGRLRSLVEGYSDITLLRLINSVQVRLDNKAVWKSIDELAESLCEQNQVMGPDVFAIIQKNQVV
jgi:hypothetical protein